MDSTASCESLDLIDRFGRGRMSRSGYTFEGWSGDERYEVSEIHGQLRAFGPLFQILVGRFRVD